MTARVRPTFRAPPIGEVVCGLQFRPLPLFQAPHYGLFWQTVRKDFPTSRTVLPLGEVPIVQQSNEPQEVTFQFGPDLPRVWFISKDQSCLMQVQPDRFLFNWRKVEGKPDYPRYPKVIQQFQRLFGKFKSFLKQNELGDPSLLKTELSYINTINSGPVWTEWSEIGEVFPDFSWRRGERYLPPLAGFNFRTAHDMPGGRLHIALLSSKGKDGGHAIRLDLTARGNLPAVEGDDLWQWFNTANTWIVDSFIDLTSPRMQSEVWKRAK